jgi:hypothetical protein
VIHPGKSQPGFHCRMRLRLSTEMRWHQPPAETVLQGRSTTTEGEKVMGLLNCSAFGWLSTWCGAYFLLLWIHSPSTVIAKRWNRFCGSLGHSDLWCPWLGSCSWAPRNPEVEKKDFRIGLGCTLIPLRCSVWRFPSLILPLLTWGTQVILTRWLFKH